METKRLFKIAENDNITVDFANLHHAKAFCINMRGKKFIAVDKNIPPESNEERVILAHELGHFETDSLYSPDVSPIYCRRFERQADGWAISHLVPLPRLKNAIKNGVESVSSLAEHFSVTEEFMQKVIKHYSEKNSVV